MWVDRHRFDAHPDLDSDHTFNVDADLDPDPDSTHGLNNLKHQKFCCLIFTAAAVNIVLSFLSASEVS